MLVYLFEFDIQHIPEIIGDILYGFKDITCNVESARVLCRSDTNLYFYNLCIYQTNKSL